MEVCLMGHEDRQELEALLMLPRIVEPLKDYRMNIVLGPGNVKRTSVSELGEEYKTTEGGRLILNGGSLTVPVADFVKDKLKLKSVETSERMEKELMHIHDKLIKDGFSKEEMTNLVKQDKQIMGRVEKNVAKRATELYTKYQKLGSEMAEVKVKEALDQLNVPGLKIRSVAKNDVYKKCKQLYEKAGLQISNPDKKDEYDIVMMYPDGNSIGLIVIEVKNGNSYPWQSTEHPPNCSLFEGNRQEIQRNSKKKRVVGSWGQCGKSYTFLSELFCDIPFGKVQAFTALPNTSRKVLEDKLGQSCCMPWVLTKEDFQDSSVLSAKLELDTIAEATTDALEVLCTMASRLLGPGSGLYVNLRHPAQVRPAEAKKLKEEMEQVDNDIWAILDETQGEGAVAAAETEENIIAIEGPPGCGKTLVANETVRRRAEKVKEETGMDQIVIVTGWNYTKEEDPLGNHLKSNAKEMGGRFSEWYNLLEEKGVDRVQVEGKNKDSLPEQIATLGERLRAEAGEKRTLLMIDELRGDQAPSDNWNYNWSALERIPKEVVVVLIFNPGYYNGKQIVLPSSCLHLQLQTTYRSTKSAFNLHSCLANAVKLKALNAPSGNPGTEVVGELPRLVEVYDISGKNYRRPIYLHF